MKELKLELSDLAEAAAAGETIEVSKHSRPYIRLISADSRGLFVGTDLARRTLGPAIVRGTNGKALAYLEEDRASA